MSQQCGKCKWWDMDTILEVFPSGRKCATCTVEIPMWAEHRLTWEDAGQTCPVYEERKECEG